jgi:hypothetical protein
MQEGFDGGRRRTGVEETDAELVHHLLVAQLVEPTEASQLREIDGRETGRLDAVQIPPAAFHEEGLDLLPDQGRDRALERRVAAAVHDEIRVATDQPRGVDAQRELLAPARREALDEFRGLPVGPAALHAEPH